MPCAQRFFLNDTLNTNFNMSAKKFANISNDLKATAITSLESNLILGRRRFKGHVFM